MLLLPTLVWQTEHGNLPNSAGGPGPYHRSWSLSFLHLLSIPFCSIASFQVKTHSLNDSAMKTVICIKVLPGDPELSSGNKASLLMPTTTTESDPHVALAYSVSWLTRAFCTSVSKKVVCSCLQDLDLLFEWHMNFSPFFIRTMAKHTAKVRERRACSDAIKEPSWDVS